MAEEFEAALRLVLEDELSKALEKMQSTSDRTSTAVERGWRGAFSDMRRNMGDAQKEIQKGFQNIKGGMIGVVSGAAFAAPIALASKSYAGFSEGMSEVATLTKQSSQEIEASFGPIVNATRTAFGKGPLDTITSLYDGFSAGVPQTKAAAQEYLQATGQMALGGKTDMSSAADAITTVKNAWKEEGLSFQEIVDQTFSGVQDGKTTITELSASMGQAATTVASAGVKYSEFIGSIAALTSAGVKTPQAMTQIAAAIQALREPGAEAAKLFKKIGAEITPLTLAQRGLGGTLDYITEKVRGHTKSEVKRESIMQKLIGSVEAGRAVTALSGDQHDKFAESTRNAQNSTGKMAEAAEKMKGPMWRYNQAVEKVKIAWENFGKTTNPIFEGALETIGDLVSKVTEFTNENRELVRVGALLFLSLGAVVMVFGAFKIALGIAGLLKGVSVAIWGVQAATAALNTSMWMNPAIIGGVVVALLAGVVAFGLWGTQTEQGQLATEMWATNVVQSFYLTKAAIDDAFLSLARFMGFEGSEGLQEDYQNSIDKIAEIEGQKKQIRRAQMDIQIRNDEEAYTRKKTMEATAAIGQNQGKGDINLGGITNNITGGIPTDTASLKKLTDSIVEAVTKADKLQSREALK
jgi:TP901 family phage tail tape measure protein